jgi:hypothetical protein
MAGGFANADTTPAYERHITEQTIATAAALMKDWTTTAAMLDRVCVHLGREPLAPLDGAPAPTNTKTKGATLSTDKGGESILSI